MTRRIYCQSCALNQTIHPGDVRMGFKERRIEMRVKKPEVHGVKVNGEFHAYQSLMCDECGEKIADGSLATAVTMWHPSREGEPYAWEDGYKA